MSTASEPGVIETPRERVPTRGAYLLVLEGREVGRRFPLEGTTTVGRSDQAGVRIDDGKASRVHARLIQDDGEWRIEDLESHNGTRVNGTNVTAKTVRFGDRIRIGETLLLLSHRDPDEERIRQRQKLEILGRLGAGVAHDMNNILASVMANAELLDKLVHDSSGQLGEMELCLADIVTASRRGAELTRRIVDQSRAQSNDTTVDLGAIVHECAELVRRTFEHSIRIQTDMEPGVCVHGSRAALHQIVMNLLVNARDAMPQGGTLRLRVSSAGPETQPAREVGFAARYAVLEVEDDGIGIPEAVRSHVFEPFFTTKPTDRGSGLGLSTVAEIVAEHGGLVTFESEVQRGTKFRVVLPALTTTTSSSARPTPLGVPRPRHGTQRSVMVVDDDALVRRAISRVLSSDGHEVLEAADGRAALELLAAHEHEVGLIVLDLDMPELDGESTFEELRARGSSVPVLFLTGLCDESRKLSLLERGAHGLLAKPCSNSLLRKTVEGVLAAAG